MGNTLLVIIDSTSPHNRYGPYLGEVLRAEGLNGFRLEELSNVDETLLAQSGVVILTRCSVTEETRDLLADYVAAGGQLIILAPETDWEPLIGLTPLPSGTVDGYLKLLPTPEVNRGLPTESLQFHGVARHWVSAGAETLAVLYKDGNSPTGFPAVASYRFGQGRVVSFTFDLGESIATTRQGNPRYAFSKLDDVSNRPRPGDLFGSGWIDASKEHVPQAEVQQALLARVIEMLSPTPLPRLWYLPGTARALLLLSGDGEGGEPADFCAQIECVERYGGNTTLYLMEDTQITPALEADWRARGHSFGLHPWTGDAPTLQLIRQHLPRQEALFRAKFGHGSRTIRSHRLQWCGYAEQAQLLAELGIGMDANFVSTPPSRGQFMTGSGRAARFVSERGTILPVWQQPTQFEDDVMLHWPDGKNWHLGAVASPFNLSTDEGVLLITQLLTASTRHYHTPITINAHPPFYPRFSGPWLDRTLAFAQKQGIPICSIEQWLDFTEARDAAGIEHVAYADGKLTFSLSNVAGDAGLTLCLPLHHHGRVLSAVRRQGEPLEIRTETIQGRGCAFFPLDAGDVRLEAHYHRGPTTQ